MTQLTDANTHATKFGYDAVYRPLCETFTDSTMRCYTYDPTGNLIARKDAIAAETVTYSFSDLYFLLQRSYTRN